MSPRNFYDSKYGVFNIVHTLLGQSLEDLWGVKQCTDTEYYSSECINVEHARTNCKHKHQLMEYLLKIISAFQKLLQVTTLLFYFSEII